VVAGDSGNEFAVVRYLGDSQAYLPIILKHWVDKYIQVG
jgi:hypothetical protein